MSPEVDPGLDGAPSVFTQPPPGQGDVTGASGTAQPGAPAAGRGCGHLGRGTGGTGAWPGRQG